MTDRRATHITPTTHRWDLICGKGDGGCTNRLGSFSYNPPREGLESIYAGLHFQESSTGYWTESVYDSPFYHHPHHRNGTRGLGGWESFVAASERGGINPFEQRSKHEIGCRQCGANIQIGKGKWTILADALIRFAGNESSTVDLPGLSRAYAVALKLDDAL